MPAEDVRRHAGGALFLEAGCDQVAQKFLFGDRKVFHGGSIAIACRDGAARGRGLMLAFRIPPQRTPA